MSTPEINLRKQYLADVLAGVIAGAAVSPIIASVDKALAENASGRASMGVSMVKSLKEIAFQPVKFFGGFAFRWIWLVYGATYVTANTVMTTCHVKNMDDGIPKLISTFIVNASTCIAKDRAFAKAYATQAAKPMPWGSYGSWVARDVGSMYVFWTLPPIVAKYAAKYTGSERTAYYASQMILPLACQTFLAPPHVLGYDIYNNPNNNFKQRLAFVQKDYAKYVGLKMVRQAPPWSVGTILNREIREKIGVIRTYND